ncbi:MAG TPA: hypothetical protein VFF64_07410 [Candidatus Eremiobacteraceae bacterium]|nr:hypothetical protein [Candidatus Eremiobacteraceae bacterium]
MSDVRAVLWDMDGTLIDSEDLHWNSWRDAPLTSATDQKDYLGLHSFYISLGIFGSGSS